MNSKINITAMKDILYVNNTYQGLVISHTYKKEINMYLVVISTYHAVLINTFYSVVKTQKIINRLLIEGLITMSDYCRVSYKLTHSPALGQYSLDYYTQRN